MKRVLYSILFCGVVVGCGPDSEPDPVDVANTAPSVPELIFPANNEECTETTLDMSWSASTDEEGDAITYKLEVASDAGFTSIVEQHDVTGTTKQLTFANGEAFYWRVSATDNEDSSDFSGANSFYSTGEGVENHVPFSPELVAPSQTGEITPGTVSLSWTAVDLDTGDTLTYDVFMGTASDNLSSEATDLSALTFDVQTSEGTTYYWRVDVKDSNGAVTVGQVWKFTTVLFT